MYTIDISQILHHRNLEFCTPWITKLVINEAFSTFVLPEIGPGWMPTILNSQAEVDFIRDSQKLLSNNISYWIGGSSTVLGRIELSDYSTRSQGSSKSNIGNVNCWILDWIRMYILILDAM